MLNISKMPVEVLETINLATEGAREIENMTPKEALNLYLKWHGIIGYTDRIVFAIDSLRASEVTLDNLKKEALESCEQRGHKMCPWTDYDSETASCVCEVCSQYVQVEVKPQPNSIDIGGPAVAVECTGGEG